MRQIFCTLPSPRSVLQWLLKFIDAKQSCFCKLFIFIVCMEWNKTCLIHVLVVIFLYSRTPWSSPDTKIFLRTARSYPSTKIFSRPQKKNFFPAHLCTRRPHQLQNVGMVVCSSVWPNRKVVKWKIKAKCTYVPPPSPGMVLPLAEGPTPPKPPKRPPSQHRPMPE